ncbi:GPI-anchored protein PB15E9.01c, partial [Biomphalaria pfeifferi]
MSANDCKAININSDYDIIVLAMTKNTELVNQLTHGAFAVLPTHVLGPSNYVVVTHCFWRGCFLGVTSGLSEVDVNIIIQSSSTVEYENQTYNSSASIRTHLKAFETIQIIAFKVNLTGSVVNSDGVIAVFSGAVYDIFDISVNSPNFRGDHMIEQMLPESMLGNEYIIAPPNVYFLDAFNNNATVVVGLFHSDTKLFYDSSSLIRTGESTFKTTDFLPTKLTSSQKVSVTLLLPNYFGVAAGYYSEPAMVVLHPRNVWVQTYDAILTDDALTTNTLRLQLITESNCSTSFKFNDIVRAPTSVLSRDNYTAYVFSLSSSGVVSIVNSECVFTGYVYSYVSQTSNPAFAYALNAVSPRVKPTLTTTYSLEPSSMGSSLSTAYDSGSTMTDVASSTTLISLAASSSIASTHDFTAFINTVTTPTANSDFATYVGTNVMTSSIVVTTLDVTPTVSDITFSSTTSTVPTTDFSQTLTPKTPIVIIDKLLASSNKTLKCPCNCFNKLVEFIQQNLTTLSKARKLEIIQKLLLKRSSLTSYRREKTSTENALKSEQYIGSTFGVVTVCVVI